MKYTRYCRHCGAKFDTDFPTKLYCTERCKYAEQLKKATSGPKKLPIGKCEECGEEFQKRTHTSKFCTKLCKEAWTNKQYLESWKKRTP